MGARLDTSASTSRATTDYTLTLANGEVFTLNAPTENGYTVWRGESGNNGEMCLSPNGSFAAINDSGAQICVCGPADEYRLDGLAPAPADMRVFGAAGIRLPLKSLGYMTLLFPSSPVPDDGVQRLAANHIVLRGYRIGMITACASPDAPVSIARSRATPQRGGRGSGGSPRAPQVYIPAGIAAARLGIYDHQDFAALLHSSRGVLCGHGVGPAAPPRDRYYSLCAGLAGLLPSLHERTSMQPPSLPGARASLDVLGPVDLHLADGARYLAVMVDSCTGHVWTRPLCDLGCESCVQLLHAYHGFLVTCFATNDRIADIVDIHVSCALALTLPWAVDTRIDVGHGRSRVVRTVLRPDPSQGLLASAAECAARQLLFRAVHYMVLAELSPRMLRAMLQASVTALNFCPRVRPMSAPRYQEWYLQLPDAAAFEAHPGALVSFDVVSGSAAAVRGIGVYICPGPSPSGPYVYDLALNAALSVSGLRSDVSPFVGLALRSSISTRRCFMPDVDVREWACASFGEPRTLGDGLGLATAVWLGHRGFLPRYVDEPGADLAVDDAPPDLMPVPGLNASALLSGLPDGTVTADQGNAALVGASTLGIAVKPNPALLGSAAELVIASIGETPNAN